MEAVESVCSYLPSQYKDECNNLVETYGEEIIDAINKEISPENLCAYIGACPKQVRWFLISLDSCRYKPVNCLKHESVYVYNCVCWKRFT